VSLSKHREVLRLRYMRAIRGEADISYVFNGFDDQIMGYRK
jgi:hypothetical protein